MPFCSVLLDGEDAHPEAFVLACAGRTPELTPFSYCFLLYRKMYMQRKIGGLQSVHNTGAFSWFSWTMKKVGLKLCLIKGN